MKKLGLVGGMGPQSTMPYYIGTVYGVQERISPNFFPPLTIESVNVFEVLRLIGAGKMDEVTAYLLASHRESQTGRRRLRSAHCKHSTHCL